MAKFSQKTLTQVAGFDGQILAQELVYLQQDFWNMAWKNSAGAPIDFTGATLDAQIIRRTITNLEDTRTGISFDIADYPGAIAIDVTITNKVDAAGTYTLVIDQSTWDLVSSDPQLDIAIDNPVCFSGRIKVSFPVVGTQPAYDEVIFLLFLVTSDGVIN